METLKAKVIKKLKVSKYNSFDDAFISAKETSDEFDFYDKSTFRIKSEIAKKSLYFFVDELNKEMYLVNNKKGYNFLKKFEPITSMTNQLLQIVYYKNKYLHFTNKYINEKEAIRLQKKDKSLYFFK